MSSQDQGRIAPVDESVVIPASVKRAAAAAEAIHRQAYAPEPDPNAPVVDPNAPPVADPAASIPPVQSQPQPDPAPQPQPQPRPDPAPQPPADQNVSEEQWEHRYHSMKGRYDQSLATIGVIQEQMRELGDENMRMQALLAGQTPQNQPQPQRQGQRHISEDDVKNYGEELLSTVQRAALDAVEPALTTLQAENEQLRQRVTMQARQELYTILDERIPNWKQINTSPRFLAWLRSPDVYSGNVRGKMLHAAFQAASAPRVLAFFNGFIAEEVATGQMASPEPSPQPQPTAPRTPTVPLASLAAPGRAKPATGDTQVPVDQPIYSRAQIATFYANVRRGMYNGREQEKATEEERIFAAQRDGRVR